MVDRILLLVFVAFSGYVQTTEFPTTFYYTAKDVLDLSTIKNSRRYTASETTEVVTKEEPKIEFPKQGVILLNKIAEKPYLNLTEVVTTTTVSNNETNKSTENKTASVESSNSEVSDLQNVPVDDTNLSPVSPKNDYNSIDRTGENVELIEDGQNTEDVIKKEHQRREPGVVLVQGQMAAILAGVFVAVAVLGYITLLSYRRYLENRYRDREMLVNEFEFNEQDDMRHFSI